MITCVCCHGNSGKLTGKNDVSSSDDEVALVLHESGAVDLAKHELAKNMFDRRRLAYAYTRVLFYTSSDQSMRCAQLMLHPK